MADHYPHMARARTIDCQDWLHRRYCTRGALCPGLAQDDGLYADLATAIIIAPDLEAFAAAIHAATCTADLTGDCAPGHTDRYRRALSFWRLVTRFAPHLMPGCRGQEAGRRPCAAVGPCADQAYGRRLGCGRAPAGGHPHAAA